MIKCNVTVCGTIGRNASARTNKEGNSFLSFPLRVTIPDRDGQNEVIEISVSKDGSQEEASGYRNGSHVEITGTLFLKRRGDKLYFNLFADRIDPVASDTADFRYSRGELLEKSVCMAYKNGRMEWKDRHHNAIL